MFQQIPNNRTFSNIRVEVLLASLFSLIGEVSPNLRALCVNWDKKFVYLFFYYDGEISEEDHESAECIATEVIANFSSHLLEIEIERLDYPAPVPNKGFLVYHRQELRTSHEIEKEHDLLKNLLIKDYSISLRVKVLLSMLVSLIGNIFPALRSVKVKWDEKTIYLFFYIDGEITQKDHISIECVITEVNTDFPQQKIETEILRWDYPKAIPLEESITIYRRREPEPTNHIQKE